MAEPPLAHERVSKAISVGTAVLRPDDSPRAANLLPSIDPTPAHCCRSAGLLLRKQKASGRIPDHRCNQRLLFLTESESLPSMGAASRWSSTYEAPL